MEVRDGFIVGISNYCDRWCERCVHSNRCRVFADITEIEFEDANGPLTETKDVRERGRLATLLRIDRGEADASDHSPSRSWNGTDFLPEGLEPSTGPDPEVVAGGPALWKRLRALHRAADPTVRHAIETIQHFTPFVPLKMMRALSQVARGDRGGPQSDANGSGKAALLGLDRMALSWQALVDGRCVSTVEAAPFLAGGISIERFPMRGHSFDLASTSRTRSSSSTPRNGRGCRDRVPHGRIRQTGRFGYLFEC